MLHHVRSLQALRGIACLIVVAYHVAVIEARFGIGFTPLGPMLRFGYAGVDLFFVLSGFIIVSTARSGFGSPARLPSFLARRAWRIYPTYWAAFALVAALGAATGMTLLLAPEEPVVWVEALLLLPLPGGWQPYGVAWTLCYELMFYLGIGLLFLLPRRAAPQVLVGWASLVIAAAAIGYTPENRFAGLAMSPYVLEFLGGALAAAWSVRLSGRWAAAIVAVALVWGAVGVVVSNPTWLVLSHLGRATVFGVPAALVVFAAAAWERGGGWPGWRLMERIGDASYSVYLIHEPALLFAQYLTLRAGWEHSRLPHLGWLVVMLTAGAGAGVLFHWCVERPLLNVMKRKKPRPIETIPATPQAAASPVACGVARTELTADSV